MLVIYTCLPGCRIYIDIDNDLLSNETSEESFGQSCNLDRFSNATQKLTDKLTKCLNATKHFGCVTFSGHINDTRRDLLIIAKAI